MSYGRQNVLVETKADGYVTDHFSVTPIGSVVRVGFGLYLMVPVSNVKEGNDLADRLLNTSNSTTETDHDR